MTDSSQLTSGSPGLQTGVLVETLRQVIPGAEIVAIVSGPGAHIPGVDLRVWMAQDAECAYEQIHARVLSELSKDGTVGSFSIPLMGITWGVLVEPIRVTVRSEEKAVGVLIVGRHGKAWSKRERSLAGAFGDLLSHSATLATRENALLYQQRLDEFVTEVAERLMPATLQSRQEVLDWTTRALAEFLNADVAFLRRNDHPRGLSVLVSEWPTRDAPDPDPLGEVPFDSDPIFAMTKDLREPYLGDDPSEEVMDDYVKTVEEVSGSPPVRGAGVPLLMGDITWGVLGFLHLQQHPWTAAEVSALQAVASMLVQLEARVEAEAKTEYIAQHDDLTALPNRRALLKELDGRLAAQRPTALLFFDLDRFKVMNDYLGHASGDKVLTTIADRLRTSVRANDFASRLGGDEFVVLVDQASSGMEVLSTAHRILSIVGDPIDVGGQMVRHTASVGIVLSDPRTQGTGMELLGRADVALYAAKKQGRRQAVVFDEALRKSVGERSRMELSLREAIEGVGLRNYYQPEVDLRTGKLLAVEALVRWEHPTRGILPASEFITVAEETGLVVEMGRWVFAEACRQLEQWRRSYPDLPIVVRVNTSPAQFMITGLVEYIADCLRIHHIPGQQMCIEITEHAVLQEPEHTVRILEEVRSLGVGIAIDDFGTGYASMTELKRLPADLLKLDMSFVQGITTDRSDEAIVEAIIRLSRAFEMEVVAEGIESNPTIDKLLKLGCYRGQGYLISEPKPADELAAMLHAGAVPLSLLRRPGSRTSSLPETTL